MASVVLFLQVRILIAVGLVLAVLLVRHRYTPRHLLSLCRETVQVKILLLVLGIFFFKQTILTTGAVASLSYFLQTLAVPVLAHRVLLSTDAQLARRSAEDVITRAVAEVRVPDRTPGR